MGNEIEFERDLDRLLKRNKRYTREAYRFLLNALHYTQRKLEKQGHVTGRELLEGIKELALSVYGPMAKQVLESWGVHKTDDWGDIVFTLIRIGLLGKTPRDKKKDFADVYDFEDVFVKGYRYRVEERKDL